MGNKNNTCKPQVVKDIIVQSQDKEVYFEPTCNNNRCSDGFKNNEGVSDCSDKNDCVCETKVISKHIFNAKGNDVRFEDKLLTLAKSECKVSPDANCSVKQYVMVDPNDGSFGILDYKCSR